mgnify:CR=1 FL=1
MHPARRLPAALVTASAVLGLTTLFPGVASAQEDRAAAPGGYVALGDSYSSGVGAGDYDEASGDCLRSHASYPELWAAANSPADFDFLACSGAVTTDVLDEQLGALDADTALVSISIGGNDAGFADAMQTCVLQGTTACLAAIDEATAYIRGTLPGRLDAVYDAIAAAAPNAEVVVLGYPHMYQLGGGCLLGIAEESRAAINGASDVLNEVISERAAGHGFAYGDVRPAFSGHEICSSDEWLHSVTLPVEESYHPTAEGHSGGYYPVLEQLA